MEWITTDDIYAETWRRLLEYANAELTIDEIKRIHQNGVAKIRKENLTKQAKQVRVAVLQAKEYFDAASSTSLFTSANHLYYGLSSLTTAIMLVLGDGEKSLDYLRKDPKNAHHGLKFTTGCTAAQAGLGLEMLSSAHCEILINGHFKNWYSTLPNTDSAFIYRTRKNKNGSEIRSRESFGYYELADFNTLAGRKYKALSLLKFFPDMAADLGRYGIPATHSRITHKVVSKSNESETHTWLLHGVRPRAKIYEFWDQFKFCPRLADKVNVGLTEVDGGGFVKVELPFLDGIEMEWPSGRETLDHDIIAYAEHLETSEIVDMYMLSYQLSMLSRYFPDLWITCLESQCKAAKLIERCVSLVRTKFPILALSLLSKREIIISTHRAPWKVL